MIERFVSLAGVSLLLATPVLAQDASAPASGAMVGRTRAQAEAAATAMVTRFDANKDGVVTRAEFDARGDAGAASARGGRMRGMWFDRADADGDGKVTAAEAKAAALARFDRLDANHDGTLSPDEMPMRRPR